MRVNNLYQKQNSKGFTLVELVVGIVLFSVAMVSIVSVIMPQAKQAIDPLWQVRGVSLAQSLLTEISSKAFDEQSITAGGRKACNDGTTSCSLSIDLGIDDDEVRSNFDDIDDYTIYNDSFPLEGANILVMPDTVISDDIRNLFLGFEARITVFYDDNTDGINDDIANSGTVIGNKKLIQIIITTPGGEEIPFSAYRKNV